MTPETFVIFVLPVLAIVIAFTAIKVVPQGYNYTVERFGRYTKTLPPGLHFIMPFVDSIGRKMNLMETVLDIPSQAVITKDNAQVSTDAVVFIQVIDAAKAAYEVNNLINAITNLALTNVRTVVGSMNLDDVLSRRDDINERLLAVIDAATTPWGVKVTRIEIKDLSPPADITASMARQMKAEREKRAEILTAEGQKMSAILKAEGEKEAAIRSAEGRRAAAFLDAEARERAAEAEAKATAMVSEAIASGDKAAINYFLGQRYVDAFEKLALSDQQRVLILPAELSGLSAMLGGIGEIAKSALGPRDHNGAARPTTGSVPPTAGVEPWSR
jgi:regulator of protease activity HflC (stomatin/prohibitin superfamily)